MAFPALAAGGSLLGGVSSMAGGKKAAGAATQAAQIQAAAAMQAAGLQQQRFEQVAQTLQPFISYGQQAMPAIQGLTGVGGGAAGVLGAPLTQLPQQWSPTMAQLANMPGYQFQLQQGLLAAQSGQAAAGLGRSGPALKAAQTYAEGLAASNWGQNWQQFLGQQQLNLQGQAQTYNMLTGQVGTGLSAAGALGGVSTQSAANIGTALQNAANAQAGGIVGATNALVGGQNALAQSFGAAPMAFMQASLLQNLAGGGGGMADAMSGGGGGGGGGFFQGVASGLA